MIVIWVGSAWCSVPSGNDFVKKVMLADRLVSSTSALQGVGRAGRGCFLPPILCIALDHHPSKALVHTFKQAHGSLTLSTQTDKQGLGWVHLTHKFTASTRHLQDPDALNLTPPKHTDQTDSPPHCHQPINRSISYYTPLALGEGHLVTN